MGEGWYVGVEDGLDGEMMEVCVEGEGVGENGGRVIRR